MKILLKNGSVVNVFSEELERADVLIENGTIIGVGDYSDEPADKTVDLSGKFICPGFIDSHIHIESTMLSPIEFSRVTVPHGTTSVVADPHEIANVCGTDGLSYMLAASEGLPVSVYFVLPSCVPATSFDEAGAVLSADDLAPFYSEKRVVGLGEVMDYPGVLSKNESVISKIDSAKKHGAIINGHAPLLSGKDLDKYVSMSIRDDHECSSVEEAKERIRKGQRVMIRQGTAAKNLCDLLPLFDKPWSDRCLLVSDDKHPADLLTKGHIDDAVRIAVANGKSPIIAIKMATINAAEHFHLADIGAIAPGYIADILVLDDLDSVKVRDVYKNGKLVVENGSALEITEPKVPEELENRVRGSFNFKTLCEKDLTVDCNEKRNCNVIKILKGQILTEKLVCNIDFSRNNGIDVENDILKIAVVERHHATGHIGLGFINGAGLKSGAIASSVSHDSHNLIIIGTNERDMLVAAEHIRKIGGGLVAVDNEKVICEMPLPIAGLMSDEKADVCAKQNENIRNAAHKLGCPTDVEPFMNMSFVSLPVIPHVKLTTLGLFDVDNFSLISLFAD